ncbi:MAG: hypothetical protein H0U84_02085, partial [Thermoleophilaceae bacterium]|nr:hypothetical protein [Thermoleophilaceae bacterium]
AIFVAFAALGLAALAGMIVRVVGQGGVFTGADSYVAVDQLQYLGWIRQGADHVAIENLYDLSESSRSFVHPGALLSGLLHRAGLGLVASFQVLKLLAIPLLFGATLAYVRRFLADPGDRRLALVVALFGVSPLAALFGWGGLGSGKQRLQLDFLAGEIWTGHYLWGYMFTAVAVALLPLGLLAYERGRAGGTTAMLAAAGGAGLLCSWLQPWQGATFALVIAGAEAFGTRSTLTPMSIRAVARDLGPVLAATAAPLFYYLILSQTDEAWELAGQANESGGWPLWIMVAGLAPLAVPALLAYRDVPRDFGSVCLRLWPLASLAVFYLPFGTFPAHAVQGLAIPLSVLAALALRDRLEARPLSAVVAVAVVAVLVVPGLAYRVDQLRGAVNEGLQPFFLEPAEHDALRYIEGAPERGGVLTTVFSGQAVPAYTGRATWLGASSWTPDFRARRLAAERLFSGGLEPRQAERLVRRSGARFVYSDCRGHPDISRALAGVAGPPRRFGCALVFTVRSAPGAG